jgi:Mg-chelatase subunit ChlD
MSDKLVYGSLQDIAQRSNKSVAETFLSVDALVMVDTSGSMDSPDCAGNRTRYDLACEQLIRLQRDLPGKVGVISWSSQAIFCGGGVPTFLMGGTDMAGVLKFVKPADGTSIKLILISDGEPASEDEALKIASQFKSKIQTIYIGPESGYGREFLRKLAMATGGVSVSQSVKDITNLQQTVTKLLTA